MEPVSLTLAVLPLAGAAVKAYISLHKKLKTFRHYSREVRRIYRRVECQKRFFYHELHLLVRSGIDDSETVKQMLVTANHPKWSCQILEDTLKTDLGDSYETYLETVDDISDAVAELQQELCPFGDIESQRQKGEPLRDTVRRLRKRIKVALNKTALEEKITQLRNLNNDMRLLRDQSKELHKPAKQAVQVQEYIDDEYEEYGAVRRSSKALHLALATAWLQQPEACGAGSEHSARLFINAKVLVNNTADMSMAIMCFGHKGSTTASGWFKLKIRSQVLDWINARPPSPPDPDNVQRKRRRVHFADTHRPPSPPEPSPTAEVIPQNLAETGICTALVRGRLASHGNQDDSRFLGFIDTPPQHEAFRHSIHLSHSEQDLYTENPKSLEQALDLSMERALTFIGQLKLARNVVTAVLKFHSTQWLKSYFGLRDFSYFMLQDSLDSSLDTLHVDYDFRDPSRSALDPSLAGDDNDVEMQCAPEPQDLSGVFEDARLKYGIRNVTLWSLGTVLLQIGTWSSATSPDKVLEVRKLSSQASALGPKYQQLTKKCLDCDFGYGDNLASPRLQQAVYESIVCELTRMIKSLSIFEQDR
ncbi:hypothetical protein PG985_014957 [Apiospora marii]|uniref:Prion-inhibition and propagation HeLo domain-containing protein n=1 Tax=Apiospora marii TaxID=335849 RepID=A0ABR1RIP7_9PEZI